MSKKTVLLLVMGVCLAALVYLSLSGDEGTLPPPLPSLPPGGQDSSGLVAGPEGKVMAPEFSLMSLSGKKISLSSLRGKVVILNFWSSTCMPCLWEMPSFEKLEAAMAGKPLTILAVTSDPRPMAERVAGQLNLKVSVLLDPEGETAAAYQVSALPVTYIIAPDGTVNNKVLGAANWADTSALDYLNKLIQATGAGSGG